MTVSGHEANIGPDQPCTSKFDCDKGRADILVIKIQMKHNNMMGQRYEHVKDKYFSVKHLDQSKLLTTKLPTLPYRSVTHLRQQFVQRETVPSPCRGTSVPRSRTAR